MKILFCTIILALLCSCSGTQEWEKSTKQPESNNEIENNEMVEPVGEVEKEDTLTYEELLSVDNTGSGWGFKKNISKKPDIPEKTVQMFLKYDTFFMDPSEEKVLYLTFDEGYENGYTGQILDTLKKCNVPAAFFVTGDYFNREKDLVRRMVNEGHIVGNHTENHPNLHKLSDPLKMQEEFKSLDEKYFAEFGEHMKYMRPPEGEMSERVLAAAKAAGYKTALWSFAYRDWIRGSEQGAKYAFDSITPYLHSGAVILLHAVSRDNADALESVINYARDMGFEFKSLDNIKLNPLS